MGTRNKGKKASTLTKSQIDIVKFFRDFKINILKHKTIYGIMVGQTEGGDEVDEVKLLGFVSVPLNGISQDNIIEDKVSGINYGIIGDSTVIMGEKSDLTMIEDEYQIIDKCGIITWLQEAVDEGLCKIAKEFDIVYLEPIGMSEFEDLSCDMNERGY